MRRRATAKALSQCAALNTKCEHLENIAANSSTVAAAVHLLV